MDEPLVKGLSFSSQKAIEWEENVSRRGSNRKGARPDHKPAVHERSFGSQFQMGPQIPQTTEPQARRGPPSSPQRRPQTLKKKTSRDVLLPPNEETATRDASDVVSVRKQTRKRLRRDWRGKGRLFFAVQLRSPFSPAELGGRGARPPFSGRQGPRCSPPFPPSRISLISK